MSTKQNRVPQGVPTGGEYAEGVRSEPGVAVFDAQYRQQRFELLRTNGYVPADQVSVTKSASARNWWAIAGMTGEFDQQGGFRRMERVPGDRRSLRQTYRGKDFAISMPSVSSVRRMAKEVKPGEPFDIPVSVPRSDGTETIGWVRVSKGPGSQWKTQPLGDHKWDDYGAVSESVRSMLEARRVTNHLAETDKKQLVTDFKEERRKSFAKRSQKIKHGWVDSVGFDENSRSTIVTTRSGMTYSYPFGKDIQRALIEAPAPGRFINKTLRGSGEVRVDECMSCHRTYASVGTHQCPAARNSAGPHASVKQAAGSIHNAVKHDRARANVE